MWLRTKTSAYNISMSFFTSISVKRHWVSLSFSKIEKLVCVFQFVCVFYTLHIYEEKLSGRGSFDRLNHVAIRCDVNNCLELHRRLF